MSARRFSCPPQSLYAQQPGPLRHCSQGQREQVGPPCRRRPGGQDYPGRTVRYRMPTQYHLQISTLNLTPSMYSLGSSSQIRMITYAGEGKTILTTAVKLRLPGATLTLSAIEEDLNNGSGFSFPVPSKWRSLVGSSTSQHSGQVSILLGGDNNFYFPKEIEQDSQGLALSLPTRSPGRSQSSHPPSTL